MAASAGVSTSDVVFLTIQSGSASLTSTVHFPSTATSTSDAFSATLAANPAGVFTDFGSQYGSISASDISIGVTSRVYSPPPAPHTARSPTLTRPLRYHRATSTVSAIARAPATPTFAPASKSSRGASATFSTSTNSTVVPFHAAYVDAGALAYDNVDEYHVQIQTVGLEAVDTCCVTAEGAPLVITYKAADTAGNEAREVTRQVAVLPICDPPSYACGGESSETVCAVCTDVTEGNSTVIECECPSLIDSAVEPAAVTVEEFQPVPDTSPPMLTPLGDGELAVTSSGTKIMLHHLLQSEAWVDPGVDAYDDIDGDVSAFVASYGALLVDTAIETPEDDPYVITYSVSLLLSLPSHPFLPATGALVLT
ncbi:hypothetical protein CYMTET_23033 [Cymbomonas tetramitiformis]|uniref:HYR domain-containing protein n=1 Tax=Cymbomonas tetramitiformis TaxID=36881 RepID=A0AAE0FZ37_9CHLO|nr:hypothetical protein CYMTET_23033 [Cymbomonas tetramitiformis]